MAIQFVSSDTENYKQIAIEAVKNDCSALKYIDPNIPEYPQIALEAVVHLPWALEFVNPKTSNYTQIALYAIEQKPRVFQYVDPSIPNYMQIALFAIQKDKSTLARINLSHGIILQALKQGIIHVDDIPDKYKSNPEFMKKVKEITNQNVV